jgi:4a-hydroxytetrahydrobiopterin dehydratase
MSEQGWREFLAADGVDDWVVLHGGPTAVFRVGSLADGARLAVAFAGVAGLGPRTTLTLTHTQVTVRLTREMWDVEPEHVEVAQALSAVADEQGAVADRSAAQEIQVAIAAKPDAIDIGFWRAVLGYDGVAPDNGIDPLGLGSTVWMQDIDPSKPLRHAMHIDVSLAREEAQRRLEAAVAAGGIMVEAANAPGGWILADRSGNKVCIAAWPDGAETPEWAAAATETSD